MLGRIKFRRDCKRGLSLFGLRLEEGVYGLLGVSYNQPFFLRSALTFWGFLLRHTMLLSTRFSNGVLPQPGIEPGSPKWARDCKSRPFAISSTGACGGGGGGRTLNLPISSQSLCPVELRPQVGEACVLTSLSNLFLRISCFLTVGASLTVSGVTSTLWANECRRHRNTRKRLTGRTGLLERRLDPHRESSLLTPEGTTREGDQ
jgi:hypothetical protein